MSHQHRLLVAEDNAAMANVEKFSLENAGFDVTLARDGSIAWKELNANSFDLVIADEQMPGMTGRELRRHMCDRPELVRIPFILVTAKRWEIDQMQMESDLGIHTMMAKPFSPAVLVETVTNALATEANL
jgi:DNA-binding response OmpR family regulator